MILFAKLIGQVFDYRLKLKDLFIKTWVEFQYILHQYINFVLWHYCLTIIRLPGLMCPIYNINFQVIMELYYRIYPAIRRGFVPLK